MSKVATSIALTDLSTKWGLVTVLKPDLTVQRQYRILPAEANAVRSQNNTVPPGCTDEEWFSGLTRVETKCCVPGQAVVNEDGTLIVNHGIHEAGGRVSVSIMAIPASEWEIVAGEVHIEADVLADMPSLTRN